MAWRRIAEGRSGGLSSNKKKKTISPPAVHFFDGSPQQFTVVSQLSIS